MKRPVENTTQGRVVGAEFLADRRTDRYSEADGPLSQFFHRVLKSLFVVSYIFVSQEFSNRYRLALNFEADCYESENHVRLAGNVSVELVKLRR
jgi:hypothetical protein